VALFHSNPDAILLLSNFLESAGFTVVAVLINDVRDGRCDVSALMARHDPSVVVYDIGPPYRVNWTMFERLRETPAVRDRRFVVTSADARQVEQLAGRDEKIFEVVDRPFDFGEIAQAVKEAARARETRSPGGVTTRPSNVWVLPERRFHNERRRPSWTSDDIYRKLREKREEVERERRQRGRRASDSDHGPSSHAA
jgi:CheY-like chemotaxis protein